MHWKRKWLYGSPLIIKRGPNGKGYVRPDGYIRVYRNGKHDLLHRWVMREHLGRALNRHEVVHHKDGNKSNNDINNLELMTLPIHNAHHFTKIKNGTKPCSYCHIVKPLNAFHKDRQNGKERPTSRCKKCTNTLNRLESLRKGIARTPRIHSYL